MSLKTTLSPSFLCHSSAVAPPLLRCCSPSAQVCPSVPSVPRYPSGNLTAVSLCQLFHALNNVPSHFPRSVELPVLPSCFMRASWHKKRHPEKLLKLSRMSFFPTLSPGRWNGFFLNKCSFRHIIALSFAVFNPSRLFFRHPSSAYAPECPYMAFIDPLAAFNRRPRISFPYGVLNRSMSLKTTFSANWEIFYPILKSESILSSHSSERCSLSYSFALKALSSALSDSYTNFTAVLMIVWHA